MPCFKKDFLLFNIENFYKDYLIDYLRLYLYDLIEERKYKYKNQIESSGWPSTYVVYLDVVIDFTF